MKLFCSILLVALATVSAAPVDTCDEQKSCVDFELKTMTSSSCVDGDCPVEVCMIIDGNMSNEHGNCQKKDDNFSHMCAQSDTETGCAKFDELTGLPQLGQSGPDGQCDLDGENNGKIFGGKCGGVNTAKMCQEGKPGDTLYWILKDGNDAVIEDPNPKRFDFTFHPTVGCEAEVHCFNHEYRCGGGKPDDEQSKKERTWAFTIPPAGGTCDVCDLSQPPILSPPSGPPPTAPIAPTPAPVGDNNPPPTPGGGGDPHFKTWKDEHIQYHGQCDLVLAKDEEFANGLGIDVHIRTKLVRYWSYIKTAVIRIGNDILEIEGSATEFDVETHYWVNYEYQAELTEFAGFPVKMFSQRGTSITKNRIEIDLSSKYPGQKIALSTFKEFVKVDFVKPTVESFGNAVGMLGDFKTGKTLARDGITELNDFTDFGREWQVLPSDKKYFRTSSTPEFPELCIEPEDPRGDRQRRLNESNITEEQAEAACAGLKDALDRKDCVYDILATQDMDMAGAF
ncbi:unnamed protein product [Cylindrotheca closterium]|uniref:VWFD domain-containing protein n=1 Tax=Cylindrotheca closterium TaxID=2856 RepID=A0AAD2G1X7_9STRA|nr:unnamed protein product [Cylindrotheca closterium]